MFGNFQPNSSYFILDSEATQVRETQVEPLGSAWLVQESQLCSAPKAGRLAEAHGPPRGQLADITPGATAEPAFPYAALTR